MIEDNATLINNYRGMDCQLTSARPVSPGISPYLYTVRHRLSEQLGTHKNVFGL